MQFDEELHVEAINAKNQNNVAASQDDYAKQITDLNAGL